MTVPERLHALATLASEWQDPEHEDRAAAVEAMLEGEARFTEEGLAFALNHRMHQLSAIGPDFIDDDGAVRPITVGVSPAELDPLGGLAEAAAALVLGHEVILERPTALVAAFIDELAERIDGDAQAAPRSALLEASDAWIVRYGSDHADAVGRALRSTSLPASRVDDARIGEYAVVLDGQEDQEALSGLAEDLLLHEGLAPGTPRIVWAPQGVGPDRLLNALAGFRELYPPHSATGGTLAMPTALLVAAKQPHATGPGFLISLGEPEGQAPSHIRWAEYGGLRDVERWAKAQTPPLRAIVATPAVAETLDVPVASIRPGDVHRGALFERDVLSFLRSL